MKWKGTTLLLIVVLVALLPFTALADKPIKTDSAGNEIAWDESIAGCTRIKDGVLAYSAAADGYPDHYLYPNPLTLGFDVFGYNYQGHMFNGSYANAYLGRYAFPPYEGDDDTYLAENPAAENTWVWPYRNDQLAMKWNDAWLSNVDCDRDGKLDRYYGFDSYRGSGAWLTNHMSGEYEEGGETCKWNYFVKIVAAPVEAYVDEPCYPNVGCTYYALDGTEIGAQIWGAFAIIQQVENDPCWGLHGLQYISPERAGLGNW